MNRVLLLAFVSLLANCSLQYRVENSRIAEVPNIGLEPTLKNLRDDGCPTLKGSFEETYRILKVQRGEVKSEEDKAYGSIDLHNFIEPKVIALERENLQKDADAYSFDN